MHVHIALSRRASYAHIDAHAYMVYIFTLQARGRPYTQALGRMHSARSIACYHMTAHGRSSHVPVQHSSQVLIGGHIQAPKAVEIHEPACTGERASQAAIAQSALRWRGQATRLGAAHHRGKKQRGTRERRNGRGTLQAKERRPGVACCVRIGTRAGARGRVLGAGQAGHRGRGNFRATAF